MVALVVGITLLWLRTSMMDSGMITMVSTVLHTFRDIELTQSPDSSCSKLGENRLKSGAAYLLFYRRRSANPLGPQELQDLVNEERNPHQTEGSVDEMAEESDSGEGKLGGPNGSLLGSSSGSTGAGVGAGNRAAGAGGTGAGRSAGSSLTTRMSETIFGPQRPSSDQMLLGYGTQGNQSWGFGNLDNDAAAHDDAARLMENMDDHDETGSTTVEMDTSADFNADRADDFDSYQDVPGMNQFSSVGRSSPVDNGWNLYDQHEMYSDAHNFQQEDDDLPDLHVENAGNAAEDDPPAVDIHPDPPSPERMEHDKMD